MDTLSDESYRLAKIAVMEQHAAALHAHDAMKPLAQLLVFNWLRVCEAHVEAEGLGNFLAQQALGEPGAPVLSDQEIEALCLAHDDHAWNIIVILQQAFVSSEFGATYLDLYVAMMGDGLDRRWIGFKLRPDSTPRT